MPSGKTHISPVCFKILAIKNSYWLISTLVTTHLVNGPIYINV